MAILMIMKTKMRRRKSELKFNSICVFFLCFSKLCCVKHVLVLVMFCLLEMFVLHDFFVLMKFDWRFNVS